MISPNNLDAKANEIIVFLATGQRDLAREILGNSQNEYWLFESLLGASIIEDGIPYPSAALQKAFPGKGKKLRATLAMLEILLRAPECMKSEKTLYSVTDIDAKLDDDNIDWFLELSNQFSNLNTLEKKEIFLRQLEHLSVSTAKALSLHQGDLHLFNVKELSVEAAAALSSHTGLLHFTGIDISRKPILGFGWGTHYNYNYAKWPCAVFEALSKHCGGLSLASLTTLSEEEAETLSKHQGPLYLNRLSNISDKTAETLSKHQGPLYLNRLSNISDKTAEALGKHVGGILALNGLTSLSDKAGESLRTHKGGLGLDSLSCLSEACAEALSKYQGSHLTLRGLDNLTKKGAELLSKYEGDLYFCGLKILEPMAAKFFGNHHGYLCFCNLKKVTKTQAEGLCNHKGTLCLKGLTSVSKETELVLRKIEKAEFVGKVANKITADFKTVAAKLKQEKEAKAKQMELVKLSIEKEMVLIPAGTFMMGSPESEEGRRDGETQHEVTLTKPFYMGKYEVTQEQWEAVMGKNPSDSKGAKLPVTNVSWGLCQAFITKLNAKKEGGYRLPTEAEWEYACRAGTTTAYSYGDSLTKADANIDGDNIKTVGNYKPSAFGLYDLHGNVSEWCEDWYGEYPSAVTDPTGPATGNRRVLRGGCFNYNESAARSSNRYDGPTSTDPHYFAIGFRLARAADFKTVTVPAAAPKPDPAKLKQEKEAKAKQMELVKLSIEKEMVLIPAGTFMMGSPVTEKGRQPSETHHEVTLTKQFYMGKYEVTQEQWESVMGNIPSTLSRWAKYPVTDVSWEDCQAFIKKLNASTKGGYRLPYEAEWEYACRAGTTTAYSYGDNLTKSDANIDGDSIKAVGSYRPNAFGVYDMHGNVWEWCEDWYGSLQDGEVTDPKGSATGESRVLRGGAFACDESAARSSSRGTRAPSVRYNGYGFRLARTP
jgi:formylglycine-generating enzyme required for sulfatase activity